MMIHVLELATRIELVNPFKPIVQYSNLYKNNEASPQAAQTRML